MTTIAAQAVKTDSKTDFAGRLRGSKIPKATPVFLTYVMLKNPSITEIDSFRPKRFWMSALVQRSNASVAATTRMYGSRPWTLNDMHQEVYQRVAGVWPATRTCGILDVHFSTRFSEVRS